MSDIYTVLSKHFVGETTAKEELLVQQFKQDNPKEYRALKAFWTKKDLNPVEVDTSKAWQSVVQKAKRPKRVRMYSYLRQAASIAAVFLLMIVGHHYYMEYSAPAIVVAKSSQQNNEVVLEDGTIVYLNSDASLTYPQAFTSNQRVVTLEGEAFFEVAKDANRPFIIHTKHSDVEVLGTSFNINTNANQTEIAVATGKVKVLSLYTNEFSFLTPNQSATITEETLEVYAANNQNYLARTTGVFHFEKVAISKVVKELNTYYDNQIVLANKDSDCLFSASPNQLELTEILEIIQLSCKLKLTIKKGIYELH